MTLDISAIDDLVTRVDARLHGRRGRLIGFIASGAGEGNSTLAAAYASALAGRLRRKVLLLEAGSNATTGRGVMRTLAERQPISHVVRALPGGGSVASLGGDDAQGSLLELIARDDLWHELRGRFDEVVIDLPSAAASRLGLAVAPLCDGVVVVLEADKTRAPVVANLIAGLRAVRANVLGTVLNKRRFYLPARVYRWL